MIKVFFDASVIFSAIYSKSGGSSKLALLTQKKKILGITSETVLKEVEGNAHKFGPAANDLTTFITENNFIVREKIASDELKPFISIVVEKDAHVLAGAVSTRADYLVTLDKKHINNESVKRKINKPQIVSPKELLSIVIENLK